MTSSKAAAHGSGGRMHAVPGSVMTLGPETDPASPVIHRVVGRIGHLRSEVVWHSDGRNRFPYTCFIFNTADRRHMFLAARPYNRQTMSLAEGERVILITQRFECDGGAAADLVYTLVSIDRQGAYISLATAGRQVERRYRLVSLQSKSLKVMRYIVHGGSALLTLVLFLVLAADDGLSGSVLAFSLIGLFWVVPFELAVGVWKWRFSLGYPSRGQRLTDRVLRLARFGRYGAIHEWVTRV